MIKISFLILTHLRPKLFNRCISSIINQNFNFDIEILVNNDSHDILEIPSDNIKYYYKTDNNLSVLYKYLFDKAVGEYIYFLEDDDYLVQNFSKILNDYISINNDIYYMNYKRAMQNMLEVIQSKEFSIEKINNHFQLSQILFKKDLVEIFPNNNNLDNDWKLFQHIINKTNNVSLIPNIMFIQTLDGKDNISFPHLNKDIRWN